MLRWLCVSPKVSARPCSPPPYLVFDVRVDLAQLHQLLEDAHLVDPVHLIGHLYRTICTYNGHITLQYALQPGCMNRHAQQLGWSGTSLQATLESPVEHPPSCCLFAGMDNQSLLLTLSSKPSSVAACLRSISLSTVACMYTCNVFCYAHQSSTTHLSKGFPVLAPTRCTQTSSLCSTLQQRLRCPYLANVHQL
jgi:hypothetical protein